MKGKGPWKITVGDEPHPRKLKAGEFTKLDEPEEEEEKDLGGEDHATEWVMHEKFLADERLESWDGTTQRPVQLADPPKELLIPEHLQLKYAKESFTIGTARKDGSRRKRGPHIIQNLIFAVREADKNFERREMLAAEQEQFLDHEAIAKAERNKLKSTRDRRNVLGKGIDARAATGEGMETGVCHPPLLLFQTAACDAFRPISASDAQPVRAMATRFLREDLEQSCRRRARRLAADGERKRGHRQERGP